MKRNNLIIFVMLILNLLSGCSSTTSLEVNNPLEYTVNVKDNAEFILIKKDTSIDETTQIIEDNLDIKTNADSYEIDWYGEAASSFTKEEYEENVEFWNSLSDKEKGGNDVLYNDTIEGYSYYIVRSSTIDDNLDLETIKENTLNHESIRPIELIIDFTKDGQTETYYKQILLCVAKEDKYEVIKNNNVLTIEDIYKTLDANIPTMSAQERMALTKADGYVSNLDKNYPEY